MRMLKIFTSCERYLSKVADPKKLKDSMEEES